MFRKDRTKAEDVDVARLRKRFRISSRISTTFLVLALIAGAYWLTSSLYVPHARRMPDLFDGFSGDISIAMFAIVYMLGYLEDSDVITIRRSSGSVSLPSRRPIVLRRLIALLGVLGFLLCPAFF